MIRRFAGPTLCLLLLAGGFPVDAADLVKAGKPIATIVLEAPPALADPKPVKGKRPAAKQASGEALAGQILIDWIRKITDAELPLANKPPTDGVVIHIGRAAVSAGLKLDDIVSPTKEGVRIVVEENRVLIGGQSEEATVKAVCRFLEELGCRYFMDSPLGEVYPRTPNLSIAPTTITEKPALLYRNPKGPTWPGGNWKVWNGAGGDDYAHSHSWGRYIPKGLFQEHPEYFAMGADGKRKEGDWLCTSNPEAREMFAKQVIAVVKAGNKHPSISPPDGRGYCQCAECRAQDDPKVLEPSSGNIATSNRYADFFDAVGKRVAKETPEAVLSFYCYADYTQPPSFDRKLSPNLCAVIAPIRYCRLHALGDPNCPSRKQQVEMVEGWAKVASKLGYYNYMYNLADATLPMFKFTPCKEEFPYLADKGLEFMTIEVLSNWYLYGPQIYLSLRLAYDPKLDAQAVMEDYFQKFYGPDAGPFMKAYWMGIDEATAKLACHSGGFYGLQAVYTPEFKRACESNLMKAAEAAKNNPAYAERVAMHTAGFRNVTDYHAICDAMTRGDYVSAKKTFDDMLQRIDGLVAKKQANSEYGGSYLKRFLGKILDGGLAATAAPNKVLQVLPDRWRLAYDDADAGEERSFHTADFDDSGWRTAATYSATLSHQGLRENTVLWYRSKFKVPEKHERLTLMFPEVDGTTTVYVNGKKLEASAIRGLPGPKPTTLPRRIPFEVDVTDAVRAGENVVAVRADNRRITELFLGGILRPVLLVESSR